MHDQLIQRARLRDSIDLGECLRYRRETVAATILAGMAGEAFRSKITVPQTVYLALAFTDELLNQTGGIE